MVQSFGKLEVLSDISNHIKTLEEDVREDIKSGILRHMMKPYVSVFTPLVNELLRHYSYDQKGFVINGNLLGITLEDVLFLTHLPVDGKPVLILNYSDAEYLKFFGEHHPPVNDKPAKINESTSSIFKKVRESSDTNVRKVGLLMLFLRNLIMPANSDTIYAAMATLHDDSDSYAWGAAMLAFLMHGLEKYAKEGKCLLGSPWLLTCFFLVRIPKLCQAIGLSDPLVILNDQSPLDYILGHIRKKSFDRKIYPKMGPAVRNILENLTDEEIVWRPYLHWSLPRDVKSGLPFATRVSPIFCLNYVVLHEPHNFFKQFGLDSAPLPNVTWKQKLSCKIEEADNRGQEHNYEVKFKDPLELWEKKECFLVGEMYQIYESMFTSIDQHPDSLNPPHPLPLRSIPLIRIK